MAPTKLDIPVFYQELIDLIKQRLIKQRLINKNNFDSEYFEMLLDSR